MKIPYDSYIMCEAGRKLPCKSILTGKFNADLIPILRSHVVDMVNNKTVNHNNFNRRAIQIHQFIPDAMITEVVAMSSYPQNPVDGAVEMFKLWKNSKEHWAAINSLCRYYCYSLGIKDECYYGIGIIIK